MKMATSFSVMPLRLATYAGFALGLLSLILIIFVIAQKFLHPELPQGWASLIATILFIGGVQTFCIGMIGEYLGRTYLKLNSKPQFVVGDTTWSQTEKNDEA
jgi:undecaprenyl-phosphate 4-deoxy-4-formamido-L-arabinose transferase